MRRLLLALACVIGVAGPASGQALTNVVTKINASGNSTTLTYASAVTPGSLLVCWGAFWNSGGNTAPTVSDQLNGGWNVPAGAFITGSAFGDVAYQTWVAYKENTAAGTPAVTVNPAGSFADNITFACGELPGGAPTSALDVATTTSSFGSAPSLATGVLAQADELILAVVAHSGSTMTITPDPTYTQAVEDESSSNVAMNAQDKIVSSTASDSADWTLASGANHIVSLATFKISGGGSPLAITTTTLPDATVGSAYSQTVGASGGTAPYTFGNNGGGTSLNDADAECAGLSIATDGTVSGTPTTAGVCSWTASVTDSASGTDTQALTITVDAAPAPAAKRMLLLGIGR